MSYIKILVSDRQELPSFTYAFYKITGYKSTTAETIIQHFCHFFKKKCRRFNGSLSYIIVICL